MGEATRLQSKALCVAERHGAMRSGWPACGGSRRVAEGGPALLSQRCRRKGDADDYSVSDLDPQLHQLLRILVIDLRAIFFADFQVVDDLDRLADIHRSFLRIERRI